MSFEDGASVETEVTEQAAETDGAETTDESAGTENTDDGENSADMSEDGADGSDGETRTAQAKKGQPIPYERFTQVNTRMKKAEATLKEKDYLFKLEELIAADPKKEAAIIKILTGEDVDTGTKDKTKSASKPDPVDEVKKDFEAYKDTQRKGILKSYDDEFNEIIESIEDDEQKSMLKLMAQMELDTKHSGWRDRYVPGLVEKAYRSVNTKLDKLFNNQKREYIKKKTSDTTAEIGKGAKGQKSDRAPIEDESKMREWVEKQMAQA